LLSGKQDSTEEVNPVPERKPKPVSKQPAKARAKLPEKTESPKVDGPTQASRRTKSVGRSVEAKPDRDPLETGSKKEPLGDATRKSRGRPRKAPEDKAVRVREPKEKCGAWGRHAQQPCRNPAGFKTAHVGQGHCHLHGGNAPVKHGRYAKIQNQAVKDLLDELEDDEDPMNLLPEVQLLRALVINYVNEYEKYMAALEAWQRSFDKAFQSKYMAWWDTLRADILETGDREIKESLLAQMPDPMSYFPSRPLNLPDILQVGNFLVRIGSLVEQIKKLKSTDTFSMATIDRLWHSMAGHLTQAAGEVIKDDSVRETFLTAVESKWGTINLAELSSRRAVESEEEGE